MKTSIERPLSVLDAIFARRSIRSFTPAVLDRATIRALLDAAVQAPTAMHLEPWAFVVVQDRAALKRYSDLAKGSWAAEAAKYRDLHPQLGETERAFEDRFASPDFCIFYDASTLIAICAKPLGPFVTADCWLAAENLMLAATALGLGSCCIGSAVPVLNTPAIKQELSIPADVDVVVPLVVGASRETVNPVSRREPQVLSWQ
jgi:nitroreductase